MTNMMMILMYGRCRGRGKGMQSSHKQATQLTLDSKFWPEEQILLLNDQLTANHGHLSVVAPDNASTTSWIHSAAGCWEPFSLHTVVYQSTRSMTKWKLSIWSIHQLGASTKWQDTDSNTRRSPLFAPLVKSRPEVCHLSRHSAPSLSRYWPSDTILVHGFWGKITKKYANKTFSSSSRSHWKSASWLWRGLWCKDPAMELQLLIQLLPGELHNHHHHHHHH